MALTKAQLLALSDTHVTQAATLADRYDAGQTSGSGYISSNADNFSASAHAAIALAAATLAGLVA